MQLLSAKAFAIFFGLAATAFCISTIVLAVQKADLKNDLQDALDKLDSLSTVSPSPTTPTPITTASTGTPGTSGTPDPTGPGTPTITQPTTQPTTLPTTQPPTTQSTTTNDGSIPTMTTPGENPVFPTLPSDLPKPEEINYRLSTDIRPIKYRIYYYPHLEERTFEGSVSIQLEIEERINWIALNSKNLEISAISILNMMARMRVRIKRYYTDEERELLIIELEELLNKNTPYTLSISYQGRLDGLTGMYASSYINEEGKER